MRVFMRRLLPLGAVMFLGLLTIPAPVFAWIDGISVRVNGTPRTPVHGEEAQYEGTGTVEYPWQVGSWTMTWKWIGDCGHETQPQSGSSGYAGTPYWNYFHFIPGTIEFSLTVNYSNWTTFQFYTNTVTQQFTVAPADDVDPDAGLAIPTLHTNPITLSLKITAGGRIIGANATGTAQRRITDMTQTPPLPPNPPDPPDGVWEPLIGYPSATFYRSFTHIIDTKWLEAGFPWDQIPVGTSFRTFTENIRLYYTAPCGELQYLPLGVVYLTCTKVDHTHWQVDLAVPPEE